MALTKIGTDGVKDDAITSGKIPANAVGSSELAANSVTTSEIATGAVVTGHLAGGCVTSAKIQDGTITQYDLADQAVTLSKLEHGTSSNDGKFLRANNGADPTFETVTGTTINNNADNRVITGSGTANTLNGESNLFFDGSQLGVGTTSPYQYSIAHFESTNGITLAGSSQSRLLFRHTGGGTDLKMMDIQSSNGIMKFRKLADTTTATDRMIIDASGNVGIGKTPSNKLDIDTSHYVVTNSGQSTTGIHLEGNHGNAGEYGGGISFACGGVGSAAIAARQATSSQHVVGLSFFTHDSSTSSDNAVEKVRIHDGGTTSFNNGIGLGNGLTYAAGNTLDDYEEGTFSAHGVNTSGQTFSTGLTGKYTKIGNLVFVSIFFFAYGGTSNQTVAYFGNLPFSAISEPHATGVITRTSGGDNVNIEHEESCYIAQGGTQIRMKGNYGTGSSKNNTLSLTYRTAS